MKYNIANQNYLDIRYIKSNYFYNSWFIIYFTILNFYSIKNKILYSLSINVHSQAYFKLGNKAIMPLIQSGILD